MQVRVDNAALVPKMRRMYSSVEAESDNDIIREIALLQAVHGWSWELCWVPRAQNEAADALSKNDMKRFEGLMGVTLKELHVKHSSDSVHVSVTNKQVVYG